MSKTAFWPSWPQMALMALSGLVLALAFAPHNFWYVSFIALLPFLHYSWRLNARPAFVSGFVFGFFYSLGILYWPYVVMREFGGLNPALACLALFLFYSYLALYWSALLGFMAWFRRKGLSPLISGPLLLLALEWIKGQALTGFPWLPLSACLASQPLLLQSAEWWGASGVSALWLFCCLLLAACFRPQKLNSYGRSLWLKRLTPALAFVMMLGGLWGIGLKRQQDIAEISQAAPQLTVSVIQGNIPLRILWNPEYRGQVLDQERQLTRQAAAMVPKRPWLVVWPESAAPFYFGLDARDTSLVMEEARINQAYIMTGSLGVHHKPQDAYSLTNRSCLVNPEGQWVAYYDKVHLVPFGEYVPWPSLFFFVRALAAMGEDFMSGPLGHTLDLEGFKIGPLICYESIFPELGLSQRKHGARLLVNQTNDAWFGRTGASSQHMSHLVLRAVECRLAVARAANTGISGFIMPDGSVLETTEIFTAAHRTAELPLLDYDTFFVLWGHWLGLAAFVITVLGLGAGLLLTARAD